MEAGARDKSCSRIVVVSLAYIQLRFDYDKTTVRRIRRYHDAFDYDGSDRNYDMRSMRLRYDYDPTTTHRHDSTRAKNNMSIFVVVVSQSYRSRIAIVI